MSLTGWCLYVARELARRHPKPEPVEIPIHLFTVGEWLAMIENAERIEVE